MRLNSAKMQKMTLQSPINCMPYHLFNTQIYSISGGNESTICLIGEHSSQQRLISLFVSPNIFNMHQVKSILHFSVSQ